MTRGKFALEDGSFEKTAEHFERALDQDTERREAYLGKELARRLALQTRTALIKRNRLCKLGKS